MYLKKYPSDFHKYPTESGFIDLVKTSTLSATIKQL